MNNVLTMPWFKALQVQYTYFQKGILGCRMPESLSSVPHLSL